MKILIKPGTQTHTESMVSQGRMVVWSRYKYIIQNFLARNVLLYDEGVVRNDSRSGHILNQNNKPIKDGHKLSTLCTTLTYVYTMYPSSTNQNGVGKC